MPKSPSLKVLSSIWRAFAQLNPNKVKELSHREVRLAVVGPERAVQDVAEFLIGLNPEDYERASEALLLVPVPLTEDAIKMVRQCDVALVSTELPEKLTGLDPQRQFVFASPAEVSAIMERILRVPFLDYIHLPLASALPGIRPLVSTQIIQNISVENAIFVVSTSLGNIIPNPLMPLASVAASAGDLVVLTANQFRMLFLLAGAYDRPLGYRHQSPEIGSILAAAFGWRSVARELVGQIPLGGGVVPKAAIAFAGTWAVGDGIAYYYKTGRRLTKDEVRQRFEAAYEKGRATAESTFSKLKDAYARIAPGSSPPESP